jgi:hypothetical protein
MRPTACLSIFDGREAVGHVAPLGARFEAYFSNDISCGVFDTPEAVLAALLAEPEAAVTHLSDLRKVLNMREGNAS